MAPAARLTAPSRRGRTLPRSFYARDPRELAPSLLEQGARRRPSTGERLAARLVEVEAYCGSDDAGSHAFRGTTPRNASMFGPPGHLYVYFTYGMHWCANVVAAAPAGRRRRPCCSGPRRPVAGLDVMRERRAVRPAATATSARARPGCVRRSGSPAPTTAPISCGAAIRLVDDGVPPPETPGRSVRIGLAAGRGDEHPWRFTVPGDPNLSR